MPEEPPPSGSGQSSFPNKLDYPNNTTHHLTCSGQSSFPNKLDYDLILFDWGGRFRPELISQ